MKNLRVEPYTLAELLNDLTPTVAKTLANYNLLTKFVISNATIHIRRFNAKTLKSSLDNYVRTNGHFLTLKPLESKMAIELYSAVWKKERNDP